MKLQVGQSGLQGEGGVQFVGLIVREECQSS